MGGVFPGRTQSFRYQCQPVETAAQDEGEWRKTAEQGAERFIAKCIAAQKVRAGLGGGTREAGLTVAESLVESNSTCKRTVGTRYRVSKYQGDGGKPDRRRGRGVLTPCARESKVRIGRFLRGKVISDHGMFSSYEDQQGAANGQDSCGIFSGMRRALDGWMLARAPASPAQDLHRRHGPQYFNFPYFCTMHDPEKLRLMIKTD